MQDVLSENFCFESGYVLLDFLGQGAYGTVFAAQDLKANSLVAIKKCRKVFQSRTMAKRVLREIRLLRLLKHENIVSMRSMMTPFNALDFNEIYIVFDIMEADLTEVIKSKEVLVDQHVQYFIYQLLLGLEKLHAMNVIHRDIKSVL